MPPLDLSVIIPTHGRSARLQSLLSDIAATESGHSSFEVVVVVDGLDEEPLEAASVLPDTIRFVGLTKDHAGPAAARNHAITHAHGRWLLFYDDDARVDANTIPGHLGRIHDDDDGLTAYLGRVRSPTARLDSPWSRLLEQTSMLFFWDRMKNGDSYGFRHFWTTNLSVRRELVQEVGGFNEAFPHAIHEDIELGWRLERRCGVRVEVDTTITCLHDHPLSPVDYLRREHASGVSARTARDANREFHDAVWPWIHDADAMLETVEALFLAPGREVFQQLGEWASPREHCPGADELRAMYLAHLPIKRTAFLSGYVGRSFVELQDRLAVDDS